MKDREELLDPRLEDLFSEAAALDPAARDAFLDRACGDNRDLRRQLDELLAVEADARGYFDRMTEDISRAGELELAHAAAPKIRLGPYQALEVLGTGGMGVVYRARRVDGEFDLDVAVKLLHLDMLAEHSRARFLSERQILAQLEHPGIARLLDGGVTEEGRPYFVMELIRGRPITEYCREHRLSLELRIRLFRKVVEAVTYLHSALIVHRDLKPSNILVDAEGHVKLVDFGIAKLIGDEPGLATMTMTGQRLLTPRYAAPEQITGGRITTATDVFGVGSVLYELLTGRAPRAEGPLDPVSVRLQTPAPPSITLRNAQSSEPAPSVAWRRVAGDLDRICLKALQPEPERRYASADQMDQDLDRYLRGMPVSARPSTLRYRAVRFIQRHRAGVAITALVVALLTAGFIREQGLRKEAQGQAARAEAVSSLLGRLITSVDPANARGREITVVEVIDGAEAVLANDPALADQPEVEAQVRLVLGQTYVSLDRRADARTQFERAIELSGGIDTAADVALEAATELALNLGSNGGEELLRRVVAIRTETRGPDHESTLSAKSALARILRIYRPELHDEAEALAREVLQRRRATLGQNHPDTVAALNGLGGILFHRTRYGDAAEIYREGLETARSALGDDHPETLRLANNLAASLSSAGRYVESEAIHREVVAHRLRILGPEHESTGMSLHNLAMVLLAQARYAEAEATYRRALSARGEGRAGWLYSKSFLADTLRELGRFDESERVFRETLAEQKQNLPPDDDDVYRTTLGFAELRLKQGELDEAAEMARDALEGYRGIYGEEHADVTPSLTLLARIERARGNLGEAAQLAGRAVVIAAATLPGNHPTSIDARVERARVALAVGDPAAALAGLPALVEARVGRLGPDHPKSRAVVELAAEAKAAAEARDLSRN